MTPRCPRDGLFRWAVADGTTHSSNNRENSDYRQICPRADLTTQELVDRLHAEGFVVRCHGLFNEDLMRHAVDVGADGATVNFPDKMADYHELQRALVKINEIEESNKQ